ncbi:hypothetical protein NKG05_20355 [Oerskovia sp. M15]
MTVTNFSDHPATFDVYASDGVVTADGQFDLLAAGTTPTDGGSWITLGEGEAAGRPSASRSPRSPPRPSRSLSPCPPTRHRATTRPGSSRRSPRPRVTDRSSPSTPAWGTAAPARGGDLVPRSCSRTSGPRTSRAGTRSPGVGARRVHRRERGQRAPRSGHAGGGAGLFGWNAREVAAPRSARCCLGRTRAGPSCSTTSGRWASSRAT